jgi:hypothetical protein
VFEAVQRHGDIGEPGPHRGCVLHEVARWEEVIVFGDARRQSLEVCPYLLRYKRRCALLFLGRQPGLGGEAVRLVHEGDVVITADDVFDVSLGLAGVGFRAQDVALPEHLRLS